MKKFLLLALSVASIKGAYAQADSLMDMLDKETAAANPRKELVNYTFKATRIINGSSVESLGAGILDFRVSHRFGRINEGIETLYGIDNANTRIGFDYGITKYLMIGIGHSVLNHENDGFLKIKLLGQRQNGTPVTVSFFTSASVQTTKAPVLQPGQEYYFSNRLCYVNQVLIARKFNDWLSLQLTPSLLHMNLVDRVKDENNIFAMGLSGRIKVSKRVAVTGEYFYRFTGQDNLVAGRKTYNSLSLGCDIETGGHVFQLHITNTPAISERIMLGQTTDSWSNGDVHWGFNISRVFTIVKPKEFRKGTSGAW